MTRNITCRRCGKQITPEQIEIGQSLICPACDPKTRKDRAAKERSRQRPEKARSQAP